jgi:hypothetical protein
LRKLSRRNRVLLHEPVTTIAKEKSNREKGKAPAHSLGIVIVFATFAIKEGKRDKLREARDSIDSAATTLMTGTQTADLPIKLTFITQQLESIERGLPGRRAEALRPHDKWLDQVQALTATVESTSHLLAAVAILQEKMSKRDPEPELEKQVSDLSAALANYKVDLDKIVGSRQPQSDSAFFVFSVKMANLWKKTEELSNQVLAKAQTSEDELDASYETYARLSNYAYILGVIVALIGVWVGSDEVELTE